MAIGLNDLVKDLTREEVLTVFFELAALVGLTTTAYQDGEPVPAILTLFAGWIATTWNTLIAPALRSQFFDLATGDWLSLRAWTDRNRKRRRETFASGQVVVENRAGGFYTISPGDIRIQNGSGKTFTNTTGGTLAAWTGTGAYPTLPMTFKADEAGNASSTPIGGIVAALVVGPTNVYAQPNTTTLQGIDEESDDSLRKRAKLAAAMLSPAAPRFKYESLALEATLPDGIPSWIATDAVPVSVTRVRVLEPGGAVVNIYLADPSGPATGDAITYGTDVYAVNAALQLWCVPPGITANVYPAVAHTVNLGNIALFVDRKSNLTAAEAIAAATSALTKFFAELPIGGHKLVPGGPGYVLIDEVKAVARDAAVGIYLAGCAASDTLLADNEVAIPSWTLSASIVDQK